MLYPCSPSLQTLPVPGIGFCQSILVDQYAPDRSRFRVWSLRSEGVVASTGQPSQTAADPPATGYRLQ